MGQYAFLSHQEARGCAVNSEIDQLIIAIARFGKGRIFAMREHCILERPWYKFWKRNFYVGYQLYCEEGGEYLHIRLDYGLSEEQNLGAIKTYLQTILTDLTNRSTIEQKKIGDERIATLRRIAIAKEIVLGASYREVAARNKTSIIKIVNTVRLVLKQSLSSCGQTLPDSLTFDQKSILEHADFWTTLILKYEEEIENEQ